MFKNVASQKVALFAFDTTTGLPKAGDGANITPYVAKDYGTVTALGTATATEMDSTNAKGWYSFVLTQGETNADALLFTAKSSTANISIVGLLTFTAPANFTTLVVDGSGRGDISKIGGTPQTARDIGASVLLSAGAGAGQLDFTTGVVKANATQWAGGTIPAVNVTGVPLIDLKYILGTALTETAGQIAAAFKKFFDKASPTGTINSIPDVVAGAAGGLFIAGSNAATTANVTGNITGNLSGSVGSVTGAVGSVTGAVGSVTGNVGGNVTGSVGSVAGLTVPSNFASLSIDANGRVKGQSSVTKNTALAGFVFVMTDSTAHAPKTGCTVSATRSLNGAAAAACTNSPTEIANGEYTIDLSAADMNANTVTLRFTAAGADDLVIELLTTP